jgi:hypothetical protein
MTSMEVVLKPKVTRAEYCGQAPRCALTQAVFGQVAPPADLMTKRKTRLTTNLALVTRRQVLAAATAAVVLALAVISFLVSAANGGSPTAADKRASGSIVVIGTGGLSWSDISPRTTPAIWSLLRDGATATLTVRSVHANTCPVDGWLTLAAGEQAADEGGVTAKPPCRAIPAAMQAGKVPSWSQYRAAAGATRFDASLGLLGEQIAMHGGCVQAIGPGAALGAARSSGMVVRYQAYDATTLPAAMAACPLTLIDAGSVRDPADIDPKDEAHPTATRAKQVAAVDAKVAAVRMAAPAGSDVVLASLSDAGVTERLRLIAVTGPHFGAGTLESSSTRQPGLVQITDLAPTILQHLGIPAPASLGGTPLRFLPAAQNSDQSAEQRLQGLLDHDEASYKVHSLVAPFFYAWALLQLALYLSAAWLWKRGWGDEAQRGQLLLNTRRVAIVAATVPASTFLANLLPWWHFSVPLVSVVASVTLFAAAISALALLGPWGRQLFGPLVVVCTTTMTVLALDVMTGSRLQISSLMGEQPVIGGRFYGMGNVTFALFGTATLMLCVAVGNHLVTIGAPRQAAAAVAAIGLGAVIIDASPSWGSDLGGPTALLPAVILLVLTILEIRLTWRRLLAIGAGVGGFLVFLGLLDWLRPAESRSHLGKFVQTALDGGAWDIVVRKLQQNITLFFNNPLSLLIPIGLVVFAYMLARPASRVAAPLRRPFARVQLLRPGLISIMVMWVIGFALNDSGAAIPAVGATLAIPLVVAIALRTLEDERATRPVTSRASRHRR